MYAGKPRPALIVQDDLFSETESVVVIPLTTTAVADSVIARVAVPTATGIAQPSFAMIDKITAVRRSNLGTKIGRVHAAVPPSALLRRASLNRRVPASLMVEIERSLMVFLGVVS
ncbi:type II toxin-antitoxin system PemK/MazF family toxin [Mycolicibacter longobardus]|uniref:type II toxin-antitoxin system PemK/MazF family toxin n=1 Tax=Mycolicibacter longobardus TaxID=1108812 RepID=UPI0021F25AB3|nr:type II toxin-antitoxin system PemK/MazF family toxin [Mycolicibacter longobardus]